jgi:hypothetical protein
MAVVLKFGKKPATYDGRDLQYTRYRTGVLPPHPDRFGHETLIGADAWGMLGNDSVGDCVFAGSDHETMLWTTEAGDQATFNPQNALDDYGAVTGYSPDAPDSDQGTDVRQALQYRQQTGLIDAIGNRHKIGAYLALEPGNINHLLEALYLFGAVGIGLQVPSSAIDQFRAGQPWSVVPGASVAGGHYVPIVANRDNLVVVTWGQLQQMTLQFYEKFCDEAWAILSPEMLKNGVSLEGFNLPALQADLQEVV